MTDAPSRDDASSDGGAPARPRGRGPLALVGAACTGFVLFFGLAFGGLALVLRTPPIALVALLVIGGAATLIARRFTRQQRAAAAIGFGVAMVVFGSCLANFKVGG